MSKNRPLVIQTPPAPPWFALAIRDDRGGLTFVAKTWTLGNVLRTSAVHRAETWRSVEEVRCWADALSRAAKRQIADKDLLVVPVTVAMGEPTHTFAFPLEAIPPDPAKGDPDVPDYGPSKAVVTAIGRIVEVRGNASTKHLTVQLDP